MTSWKDTPGSQGFLPVAIADAKVAATHAGYMQKSPDNLDSLKLHAGHVLNALDPSIEAKGPGSGYGVKRAAAGASQHVQLAAKTEGASKGVQTHAGHVTASLADVTQWTDAAIATAQKIRAATSAVCRGAARRRVDRTDQQHQQRCWTPTRTAVSAGRPAKVALRRPIST